MHLIRTLSPVVASILVALGSPAFAQTAKTDPVGFTTLPLVVGTSLVVPTLNSSSVFVGMAAISADGSTITPTSAPGWTAGAFARTSFAPPTPNYPTHYAEVISGPQEGLVIDIDNNTTTALNVTPSEISVASGLRGTTVQIAVRKHVTLDKVIVGATGLTGYSDGVSVYNSNGSQSVRYFDGGTSFVDESFLNAAGHTVIYPGTGFVISVNAPVTLTFLGDVKTTKTQVNLYAGATNVVGPLSPSSSTLLYGNTLASALAAYSDGVNNFSANGAMATLGAYYSDGAAMLNGSFSPLLPTDTDAIALNRGVVVTVNADSVWTVNPPAIAP